MWLIWEREFEGDQDALAVFIWIIHVRAFLDQEFHHLHVIQSGRDLYLTQVR